MTKEQKERGKGGEAQENYKNMMNNRGESVKMI